MHESWRTGSAKGPRYREHVVKSLSCDGTVPSSPATYIDPFSALNKLDLVNVSKPTTLLIFSNLFDSYGISCHRSHAYELDSYLELPNLYVICVIDELARPEKMVAGLIIKTNIPFGDPGFLPGITTIISLVPELSTVVHEHCGLLPAPIDVESAYPLSEDQALYVVKQLWSEHQAKQILHALPKLHVSGG